MLSRIQRSVNESCTVGSINFSLPNTIDLYAGFFTVWTDRFIWINFKIILLEIHLKLFSMWTLYIPYLCAISLSLPLAHSHTPSYRRLPKLTFLSKFFFQLQTMVHLFWYIDIGAWLLLYWSKFYWPWSFPCFQFAFICSLHLCAIYIMLKPINWKRHEFFAVFGPINLMWVSPI